MPKKINFAEPEEVVKKESKTEPDCGLFVKGEHERCFAYSTQTACDKHGLFADAKEQHCLRYTNYRGLAKVSI